MTLHRSLLCALTTILMMSGCGDSGTSDASLEITARDVAWATDWHIVKFDLSDAEPFYAAGLVVVDDQGKAIESSGGLVRLLELSSGDEPLIARIAINKEGTSVSARYGINGSGSNTEFEDIFNRGSWYAHGEPDKVGDYYYLAGDSSTVGFGQGTTSFEPGSRHIALKLYRTEAEFDARPQ